MSAIACVAAAIICMPRGDSMPSSCVEITRPFLATSARVRVVFSSPRTNACVPSGRSSSSNSRGGRGKTTLPSGSARGGSTLAGTPEAERGVGSIDPGMNCATSACSDRSGVVNSHTIESYGPVLLRFSLMPGHPSFAPTAETSNAAQISVVDRSTVGGFSAAVGFVLGARPASHEAYESTTIAAFRMVTPDAEYVRQRRVVQGNPHAA